MKVISSIVSGDAAAKDKAFGDGLYVAGDRYVLARAEDQTAYARSVCYLVDLFSSIRIPRPLKGQYADA